MMFYKFYTIILITLFLCTAVSIIYFLVLCICEGVKMLRQCDYRYWKCKLKRIVERIVERIKTHGGTH